MPVHLHKYMEEIAVSKRFSFDFAKTVASAFTVFGKQAVCFDMGELEDYEGMKAVRGLYDNLPFDTCWFEVSNPSDDGAARKTIGILCNQHGGEKHLMVTLDGVIRSYLRHGSDGHIHVPANSSHEDTLFHTDIMDTVYVFCSILNCKNIRLQKIEPDAALQKARAKRGKMPLFSYHVLDIKPDSSEPSKTTGCTHASPRFHLRRGHIRRFSDGTYTWVQACGVGDKKLGMVHKDYRFQAEAK